MADKPSSLLDDVDFTKIGQSKAERAKSASGGGGAKGVKIAVIVACFLVAGLGIAWQAGMFERPLPSTRPGGHGALTNTDKEAAKKQEQKVQEDLKNPDIAHGPS